MSDIRDSYIGDEVVDWKELYDDLLHKYVRLQADYEALKASIEPLPNPLPIEPRPPCVPDLPHVPRPPCVPDLPHVPVPYGVPPPTPLYFDPHNAAPWNGEPMDSIYQPRAPPSTEAEALADPYWSKLHNSKLHITKLQQKPKEPHDGDGNV